MIRADYGAVKLGDAQLLQNVRIPGIRADRIQDKVRRILQAFRVPVDHQKIHVCL